MPNELTADDLRFTPPRLPVGLLIEFLADHWGINGEFAPLVGERDQNFRVRTTDGKQYVFKIASPIEDATLVDFQVQGLLHLQRNDPGIPVPHMSFAC
jgi:Ser/Thr protein kinase RdoA (MazF antagonist)